MPSLYVYAIFPDVDGVGEEYEVVLLPSFFVLGVVSEEDLWIFL